jgi:K+-transporting ATPase ATPase C chain
MLRFTRQVLGILAVLTLITGLVYPLVVTGIAQLVFPHQANGSLVYKNGKAVGSELIGQAFTDPNYFWPRPSATNSNDDGNIAQPYNAANSAGSNLGPLNPALVGLEANSPGAVRSHVLALQGSDPASRPGVPVDLVTASASGLDPDISPAAAEYQVPRVAKARRMDEAKLRQLVAGHTKGRQLGILGEPRVNVLELNLALDIMGPGEHP